MAITQQVHVDNSDKEWFKVITVCENINKILRIPLRSSAVCDVILILYVISPWFLINSVFVVLVYNVNNNKQRRTVWMVEKGSTKNKNIA